MNYLFGEMAREIVATALLLSFPWATEPRVLDRDQARKINWRVRVVDVQRETHSRRVVSTNCTDDDGESAGAMCPANALLDALYGAILPVLPMGNMTLTRLGGVKVVRERYERQHASRRCARAPSAMWPGASRAFKLINAGEGTTGTRFLRCLVAAMTSLVICESLGHSRPVDCTTNYEPATCDYCTRSSDWRDVHSRSYGACGLLEVT